MLRVKLKSLTVWPALMMALGLSRLLIDTESRPLLVVKAALDEGKKYARDRKAFGKALTDFQATQFALADSAVDIETAWLLVLRAAHEKDSGSERTAKAS